jgi:hypothetical protein
MSNMSWKVVVWWFENRMACLTSHVFENWMMSLNVNFKYLKRKGLIFIEKYVTHSLEHVGRGESFGFQPCK